MIFQVVMLVFRGCTLPETNIAPKNGWLEYYCTFLLGRPIFRGYVSFREGTSCFFSCHIFLNTFCFSFPGASSWRTCGTCATDSNASPFQCQASAHCALGGPKSWEWKWLKMLETIRMSPKIGEKTQKWMVYFMENSIKMYDLGVPLFLEAPIWNN